MTHVTCRLTAKNRDQLRNPTLGNRVWATFAFFTFLPMTVAWSSSGGVAMLCTSGFMDDVILAHKPRQLNVAVQLMEVRPTRSLGLGYKRRVGIPVAGQWTHTHGPTFRAPRSWPTRPQWACCIFMTSCLHTMALRVYGDTKMARA